MERRPGVSRVFRCIRLLPCGVGGGGKEEGWGVGQMPYFPQVCDGNVLKAGGRRDGGGGEWGWFLRWKEGMRRLVGGVGGEGFRQIYVHHFLIP